MFLYEDIPFRKKIVRPWHNYCNDLSMAIPRFITLSLLAGLAFACSSSQKQTQGDAASGTPAIDLEFVHIESTNLPRLLKLSDRVYSGAEPKIEQSFAELSERGIRTLICVDGAKPKVEWADKFGLRYIHIPIGYDGIKAEQAAAFISVVRNCDGPFYFHCHHGRHRGPAAAAIAFMADSQCGAESGLAVLTEAGTSEHYPGLWRDVKIYQDWSDLKIPEKLPEVAKVDDFNSGMAVLDRLWDETKLVKKANWKSSAEHPDLDPQRTTLILAQAFEDLDSITPAAYSSEALYAEQMTVAKNASSRLVQALKNSDANSTAEAYGQIRKSCKECHFRYRDS